MDGILVMYNYVTTLPRWHVLSTAAVGYVIYYFLQVARRPMLAISNGPFKNFLLNNIPTLKTKFWPTFWCVESRAQTVIACLLRSSIMPTIDYEREILTLKDGGEVALDWLVAGCDKDSPIIIILPGLTGGSQAEYIKYLVLSANSIGMRIVVFNNRGLGGVPLKTPRLYCAANCEDLSEVVIHVKNRYLNIKIGAAGVSMGGLLLGNYLSEHGDESSKYLTAAKIISAPWDVFQGSDSIEKPLLNQLLGRHLVASLCDTLKRCDKKILEDLEIDMKKVLSSKTIKEFDSHFTSKHFGYSDVDSYYNAATLHNKLHKIRVPVLCLNAADDPFQPLQAIPIIAAENSTHVAMVITARGGHIGFLEGWWPSSTDQYMGRLFNQFFSTTLIDENDEFRKISEIMYKEFLKRQTLDMNNLIY